MYSAGCQKTRVLLIYSPENILLEGNKFNYFVPIFPPLGLSYIAAVLERSGYEVQIIDAKVERLSINEILRRVSVFNPHIIGLSSSTPDFCITKSLAKQIKALGDYTVLIGGPHVSALPEETMQEGCFDYGILGEGERTVAQLVNAMASGNTHDIPNIKGIVFNNGSQLVRTPPQPYIEDLDTLPFPARHLLPNLKKYNYSWYKYLPTATIITTRGCPYQCIFCDRAVFGNKLRMRSIENILDEIGLLVKEYNIRGIDIVDDLFTVTPERVMEFCNGLIKRNLKISWSCMGRADCINLETLKVMKKAGCWQIGYGIESGNQSILDNIKKNLTLDTIEKAVKWTQEAGIRKSGLFILGLPGETEATMQDTLEFAKKISLDRAVFFTTQPFPGSELYRIALARGEIAKDVEYRYYHKYFFPEKLAYISSGITKDKLRKYQQRCYRDFYLRPSHILKQFLKYYEVKEAVSRTINFLKAIS